MKYRRWIMVWLALYPLLCGFDIYNLPQQAATEWRTAIEAEWHHLQAAVPETKRNADYWYLYGNLKYLIFASGMRYTKFIQDRLTAALPACDGLYADDPAAAEDCRRRLKGLMPEEFFKDR